jgi:hypothetical protein
LLCESSSLLFCESKILNILSYLSTTITNADNMGLGKVCIFLYRYISVDHMMIRIDIRKPFTQQSIFVTTLSPHRRCLQSICLILSNHPDLDEGDPCCTLIVSPVSIIAN